MNMTVVAPRATRTGGRRAAERRNPWRTILVAATCLLTGCITIEGEMRNTTAIAYEVRKEWRGKCEGWLPNALNSFLSAHTDDTRRPLAANEGVAMAFRWYEFDGVAEAIVSVAAEDYEDTAISCDLSGKVFVFALEKFSCFGPGFASEVGYSLGVVMVDQTIRGEAYGRRCLVSGPGDGVRFGGFIRAEVAPRVRVVLDAGYGLPDVYDAAGGIEIQLHRNVRIGAAFSLIHIETMSDVLDLDTGEAQCADTDFDVSGVRVNVRIVF